jgi:putative ABC transport system permease protein
VNGTPVDRLLNGSEAAGESGSDGAAAKSDERQRGGRRRNAAGWTLRREYRSTYRSTLTGTERLVAGSFVGRATPGTAVVPISIEEGLMHDMGVKLGDEIEWDVQGVPLRTRISSVRAVEWRRLEPNFFVVFPEGVLEPAPKFYVVAVRANSPGESARVQRSLVSAFPNVTAIDLALILQTLDGIFSKVAFVLKFMDLFTVATGLIVLAGVVVTGRYQRVRETVLLRTVGATRRQLMRIMLVEYTVLGVMAAVTGGVLAVGANLLLARFVFHTAAVLPVADLAAAVVAAVTITLGAGVVINRGVTNHPPLEVLRQET